MNKHTDGLNEGREGETREGEKINLSIREMTHFSHELLMSFNGARGIGKLFNFVKWLHLMKTEFSALKRLKLKLPLIMTVT